MEEKTEKNSSWNFNLLWKHYPKENHQKICNKIDGYIKKKEASLDSSNLNTVKVSYALNRSCYLIPYQPHNKTASGYTSDDDRKTKKKWFFHQPKDLKEYINDSEQYTEKMVLSKDKNVIKELNGKKGIVFFESSNKTGDSSPETVTLWNGKQFIESEHDKFEVAEQTTIYILR